MSEKNNENKHVILRSLLTGLTGGILLYISFLLSYYFNFIDKTIINLMLSVFNIDNLSMNLLKLVVVLGLIIVTSIISAIFYHMLLKKFISLWIGVLYGIFHAGIFLMIFHLFVQQEQSALDMASYITITSLFILYGIFIGYSISFDYQQTMDYSYLEKNQ